jgi:phage-related protein
VAVELATAYISLVPSTRGIAQGITGAITPAATAAGKNAGTSLSGGLAAGAATGSAGGVKAVKTGFVGKMKGAFSPIGGMLTGALAIGAGVKAVGFVSDATAEAREAQKVGAVTEQIIRSTGGAANVTAADVGALAGALSAKVGMDDEAIQSGANLLLTFKNVRNEVGEGNDVFNRATAAAADLSAAGFGDLNGASKQLGKALNDPVAGISALSRSGVTFTDQQKEQIKTLVASGDTLGAQKIILAEVESQVGGTAAASATASEKMGVSFGNFKEAIGTALLPVIDTVTGALQGLFDWMAANPTVVMVLVGAIGLLAVGLGIAAAAAALASATFLTLPITWIIVGIVALIAGLVALIANWSTVVAWLKGVWGAIVGWLAGIWNSIKAGVSAGWNAVAGFFSSFGSRVASIVSGFVGRVVAFFADLWNRARSLVSGGIAAVVGFFSALPARATAAISSLVGRIGSFFSSVFNTARGAVSTGISNVVSYFRELPGRVLSGLGNLGSTLVSAGRNLISGLIDGIQSMASGLVDKVMAPVRNAVNTVKGFLGIGSLSKLFRAIGVDTIGGLIAGVGRSMPAMAAAMGGVTDALAITGPAFPAPGAARAGALVAGGLEAGGAVAGRVDLSDASIERLARAILAGSRNVSVGTLTAALPGVR